MTELPTGWLATTIGEVADVVTGKTPPTAQAHLFDGDLPFVKPGDLDGPRDLVTTESSIAARAFDFIPRLPAGSVLVSCIGNLGKTAILAREGSCNQQLNAILPTPAALPAFLYAWAKTLRPWLDANSSATTVSIINKGRFLCAPLALPPLNEQRRIVTRLEALQARSRRAREALDAVPPLLEKLRQSILAVAFRGDLTKDWRAKHKDVEPASRLLERIRAERRKKWEEAELAKLKAKGKAPKGDEWKAKYKEPEPVDTTGLPELPEGWCWVSPDELSAPLPNALTIGPFGSDLKVTDYRDAGVPLVFVREIRAERFGDEKTKFVTPEKAATLSRHTVRPGDLLMTKMGDPPGDTAVYPSGRPPAIVTADCIKLTPFDWVTDGPFLMYCFRAPTVRSQLLDQTAGVAQQKLSLERFRTVHVPLPPPEEQRELVTRLDALLAHGRQGLEDVEYLCGQIAQLERASLAMAFRGDLVPQDPNDESADVMLARVRDANGGETNGRTERAKPGSRTRKSPEAE